METEIEKSVVEGNKIIAEFMGWKYIEDGNSVWNIDKQRLIFVTDLKYHSDWNYLMGVVEKIEDIKDEYHGHFGVHISSNGCTIQATKFRPRKPIANPPHYFADYSGETKISGTWQAVIEFITWYNNQKQ